MITKALEKMGLTKNEADAYLALVENGPQPAGQLSKLSGLNRTTLYGILNGLVGHGIVTTYENEIGVTFYHPIDPKGLLAVIEKKEKELAIIRTNIKNALPQLEATYKGPTEIPKVKFFEGRDGVQALYLDSLINNKEKKILAITDYEAAYKTFPKFFEEYFQERVKKHISVKNILPDSKRGREDLKRAKKLLRKMKFIPLVKELKIEINLYDDKVSIVSFNPEEIHGVLIQSQVISQALKNIFSYIWDKTGH